MDIKNCVRNVPDFPKPGIQFKDITPLLSDPKAFTFVIEKLVERYSNMDFDVIAAAEARGFIFASPLAIALQKPFVPLRKPGKLPYKSHSASYALEYGDATLHMHIDAVERGQKVLLIDDLLATGGTMNAARMLMQTCGAKIAEFCFIIELEFLNGRQALEPDPVFSVIKY